MADYFCYRLSASKDLVTRVMRVGAEDVKHRAVAKHARVGERFVGVIAHYPLELSPADASRILQMRQEWTGLSGVKPPVNKKELRAIIDNAKYGEGAEKLLEDCGFFMMSEGLSESEKIALFNSKVKQYLKRLPVRQAHVLVLSYGLENTPPKKAFEIAGDYKLTTDAILNIRQSAINALHEMLWRR